MALFLILCSITLLAFSQEAAAKCLDHPVPKGLAIVTLVLGGNKQIGYTMGAVALGGSLRALRGEVALLAMITPDVERENRMKLKRAGLTPVVVESLEGHCFGCTKLHAWNPGLVNLFSKTQTDNYEAPERFEILGFLDADVVAIRPCVMARVLVAAWRQGVDFAAAPATFPPDKFNSGVLVIRPDMHIFSELIRLANDVSITKRRGADQHFLWGAFPQWFSGPLLEVDGGTGAHHCSNVGARRTHQRTTPTAVVTTARLSTRYNLMQHCLTHHLGGSIGSGKSFDSFSEFNGISEAVLVHFTNTKPWNLVLTEQMHPRSENIHLGNQPWSAKHPLYVLHDIWRRAYVSGFHGGLESRYNWIEGAEGDGAKG